MPPEGQGGVHHPQVDVSTLSIAMDSHAASRGLAVFLAQLKPRSFADIATDSPNLDGVRVLSALLSVRQDGSSVARDQAQPGQTVVVLCPEYAFAASDLPTLYGLVAAYTGQLIVVSGFGASSRESVEDARRAIEDSGANLHLGWDDLPPERRVNFGAALIRESSGSTYCALYGKNYPEQGLEIPALDITQFEKCIEIKLNDLRILPFICADLIEQQRPGGDPTVSQRMIALTQSLPQLPTLCLGSLLQPSEQASEKWQVAISTLISSIEVSQCALALSNVATRAPDPRSGGERWTNLTGVYVPKTHKRPKQLKAQPPFGYFEGPAVMAWPVRSFRPHVTFATILLPPYESNTGLHPCKATKRWSCTDTGDLVDYPTSAAHDELFHCAHGISYYRGGAALDQVLLHLSTNAFPEPLKLIRQFSDGPFARDADHSFVPSLDTRPNLQSCLAAADALLTVGAATNTMAARCSWQERPELGQLRVRCENGWKSVALWSSHEAQQFAMLTSLREKVVELGKVAGQLFVFGEGADGDFDREVWSVMSDLRTEGPVDRGGPEAESLYADLPVDAPTPPRFLVHPQPFRVVRTLVLNAAVPAGEQDLAAVLARCDGAPT